MSILARRDPGRLRLAAIAIVILLTIVAGYAIEGTPPSFLESATVVFRLPRPAVRLSQISLNRNYGLESSLIMSGEAMTQILMSPQQQHQIAAAGGTGSVSLNLVNFYDQEYPEYGVPLATLTVASPDAGHVHGTFVIAARRLGVLLAAWQARMGVKPANRISELTIGDTGPVAQSGSSARVLAGLLVLALVAIAALSSLIGRARPPGPRRPPIPGPSRGIAAPRAGRTSASAI